MTSYCKEPIFPTPSIRFRLVCQSVPKQSRNVKRVKAQENKHLLLWMIWAWADIVRPKSESLYLRSCISSVESCSFWIGLVQWLRQSSCPTSAKISYSNLSGGDKSPYWTSGCALCVMQIWPWLLFYFHGYNRCGFQEQYWIMNELGGSQSGTDIWYRQKPAQRPVSSPPKQTDCCNYFW